MAGLNKGWQRKYSLWIAGILLVAGAGAAYWFWPAQKAAAPETASISRRNISSTVTATGSVKAMVGAEVKIGSRISGRVEKIHVAVGDPVEKGQLVVEIDARELEGNVRKAESDLKLTVKNLELSQANYQRIDRLFRQGALALSQKEVAEKELASSQSQYETNRRAVWENAQTQLSYASLRSPISGTVASVTTQEGETVSAGNQAPTFVTVVDLNRLQIDVYVDETDIAKIRVGMPAQIVADAFPTRDFEGTVTAVAPKATILNNVVYYVATVAPVKTEGLLKPDMTVNAVLMLEERPNVLAAPNAAVRKEDGKTFVRLWQNGAVTQRAVRVGSRDGKYIEIVDGVKEKDVVVVGDIPAGKP
ncbi:MAG: efflux RND transporter periplasmic adaptor subunit [Negativicutes bacterium]